MHQIRKLTLVIDHPGLIWTVIAFDADIIAWDLPELPQRGLRRHHVKEVSSYGVDQWKLQVEVQLDDAQFEAAQRRSQRRKGQRGPDGEERDAQLAGLTVDFSGLDREGMWPAHQKGYNGGKPGMDFMKQLDAVLPDWVDSMLLSAVSGRVTL